MIILFIGSAILIFIAVYEDELRIFTGDTTDRVCDFIDKVTKRLD